MIEDLKKLLPREKEIDREFWTNKLNREGMARLEGYNEALAFVEVALPSLVEYIYADLREKMEKLLQEEARYGDTERYDTLMEILELLTPNK